MLLWSVREPRRREDTGILAVAGDRSVAAFVRHLRRHLATFARVLTYPTLLSIVGYGALAWAPALFDRRFAIPASRSGVILGILVALAGGVGAFALSLVMLTRLRLPEHEPGRIVPAEPVVPVV